MKTIKNLKESYRDVIHTSCLDIVNLFNLDNKQISSILGCKENTACKKKINTDSRSFIKEDLDNLYYYMDNQIRLGMITRRQIKNFLDFLEK
jgi:hypothetical protein